MSTSESLFVVLQATNVSGHAVQLETHVTGQGDALVLVRPRSQYEETALGTGFIELVAGLGVAVEAPGREVDERQTGIEHRDSST